MTKRILIIEVLYAYSLLVLAPELSFFQIHKIKFIQMHKIKFIQIHEIKFIQILRYLN